VWVCVCRHVKVLCEVVTMIVNSFSDKIVAWQGEGCGLKALLHHEV